MVNAVYDVIYKGYISQTHEEVATLKDAVKKIDESGLNPNHFVIRNNFTGKELIYKEIQDEET